MVLLLQNLTEAPEAFFGEGDIGGAEAFLRTVDARAAAGTEEGVGDIDGDGEAKFQAARRWNDAVESGELRPVIEFAAGGIEEFPAKGAGEAEAGVVGGAAADADDTTSGAGAGGSVKDATEAEGIELEGVKFLFGEQGQTDDAGGFDEGEFLAGDKPPLGGDGFAGGVEGFDGAGAGAEEAGEDGAETIATIAHGEEIEVVVGAGGFPAVGDGGGGGLGGESAFEFIGDDEEAEGHGGLLKGEYRSGGRKIFSAKCAENRGVNLRRFCGD